ncbi:hypothetical protein KFL_001900080 [Klebsormidium nitens]|uniref:Uncharacterized protein n=1 Tax=Klebsormidium nitens TaxID=105231 RepID=A0A1Y1I0M5_KLENI|nr:hypothetical protein KFL_001900080 [Klebsormidium nitens]|eukprot:GAQ84465.1 hypothetical protein KFL_001900080 [Klebsormidium nitens]
MAPSRCALLLLATLVVLQGQKTLAGRDLLTKNRSPVTDDVTEWNGGSPIERRLLAQGSSVVSNGVTEWSQDGQSQFGFNTRDGHVCQTGGGLRWGCKLNGAVVAKIPVNVLPVGLLICFPFVIPVVTPPVLPAPVPMLTSASIPTVLTPTTGSVPAVSTGALPGIQISSPGGISITPNGVTVGTGPSGPGVALNTSP